MRSARAAEARTAPNAAAGRAVAVLAEAVRPLPAVARIQAVTTPAPDVVVDDIAGRQTAGREGVHSGIHRPLRAGNDPAHQIRAARHIDLEATVPGLDACRLIGAGVVAAALGRVAAHAAGHGRARAPDDAQAHIEATTALLGCGGVGVLQAGDVEIASDIDLHGVGGEHSPRQRGVAAAADGEGVVRIHIGVDLGHVAAVAAALGLAGTDIDGEAVLCAHAVAGAQGLLAAAGTAGLRGGVLCGLERHGVVGVKGDVVAAGRGAGGRDLHVIFT